MGLDEAHGGTLPKVNTKSVTPWAAAAVIVPSTLVQLKDPGELSIPAHGVTSQSRNVANENGGNAVMRRVESGCLQQDCVCAYQNRSGRQKQREIVPVRRVQSENPHSRIAETHPRPIEKHSQIQNKR